MAEYWDKDAVDAITPPQVYDERGRAVLQVINEKFGDQPLTDFFMRDPLTCQPEVLQALIAEFSLEEFIAPGLAEQVVRDIINNAWQLHEAKGYDEGVLLGLSLLGIIAEIEHWHETVPMGPPNTHVVYLDMQQILYSGDGYFGERALFAASKMIDATKRWSQDTKLRVKVTSDTNLFLGIVPAAAIYHRIDPDYGTIMNFPPLELNLGVTVHAHIKQSIGVANG